MNDTLSNQNKNAKCKINRKIKNSSQQQAQTNVSKLGNLVEDTAQKKRELKSKLMKKYHTEVLKQPTHWQALIFKHMCVCVFAVTEHQRHIINNH